jgi:hypothetical protein
MRNVYKMLVGKPERREPLHRPRRRWEDNIKFYLKGFGCDRVDWVFLLKKGTNSM